MKKYIPCMSRPCHKIYRVEAVGLKSSHYTLTIKIFENVKFGAVLLKFDILSITAYLKFDFKNPSSATHHVSFLLNRFSV